MNYFLAAQSELPNQTLLALMIFAYSPGEKKIKRMIIIFRISGSTCQWCLMLDILAILTEVIQLLSWKQRYNNRDSNIYVINIKALVN